MAERVYVTVVEPVFNEPGSVAVIDTATNTVIGSPIPVGSEHRRRSGDPGRQEGLCREPKLWQRVRDRHRDEHSDRPPINGRQQPSAVVAVTPDGSKVYVANTFSNYRVGDRHREQYGDRLTDHRRPPSPTDVAVTPDGSKVYVTNSGSNTRVGDRYGDQYGDRPPIPVGT